MGRLIWTLSGVFLAMIAIFSVINDKRVKHEK